MFPTVKPIKGWTGAESKPFSSKSFSVNVSHKKGFTTKKQLIYGKCENKEVIGSEQVYEHENDDKPKVDLQINAYNCAMLNDFELYNVHAESAEIDKWSILNTKIDYIKYNRKELSSNKVKFS